MKIMKMGFKPSILAATAGLLLSPLFTNAAEDKKDLTSEKEKVSYSIGMNIGRNLKRGSYDVDVDVLANAIREFLAENKKKPGVKSHLATLPEGGTAEMQYKIIIDGSGPSPKTNDIVTVNY